MDRRNFERCLEFVLEREGGYVNDPDDLGRETYRGISRRYNPDWPGWPVIDEAKKDPGFPGCLEEIKSLGVSVALRYRNRYWDAVAGDSLPWPLCLYVFDSAVLCGPRNARRWEVEAGEPEDILFRRIDYHSEKARRKPHQNKFFRGWVNRVSALYWKGRKD